MARVVRNPHFNDLLREAIADGLAALGIGIQADVKRIVSTPGKGRIYKRPGKKRTHQASAPGDPPTVDTGNYRRSIQVNLSKTRATPQTVQVGTNVKVRGKSLGAILEFGSRKIAARPHWRIVLRTGGPIAIQRFTRAAKARLRRGA